MQLMMEDLPTSELPTIAILMFSSLMPDIERSLSVYIEQEDPLNIKLILINSPITTMDPERRSVRVIETTKGELKTETELEHIKVILFHQNLTPLVYPQPSGRPITMENLDFHKGHPKSLQNTCLTPSLLEHEMQVLGQLGSYQPRQILILDGSSYHTKINEIFDKYVVVRGYTYKLDDTSNTALLGFQHIQKQLDYQFTLGNGKYKPGFIGEVLLSQCLTTSPYYQAYKVYLNYSHHTHCPIFINCLEQGELPTTVIHCQQAQRDRLMKDSDHKWSQLESILTDGINNTEVRLVVFNPSLLYVQKNNLENYYQFTQCLSHKSVLSLLENNRITVGFDLAKYANFREALSYIAMLCLKYPSKIILSSGLSLKTQLSPNGGDGYRFNAQRESQSQIFAILSRTLDESALRCVTWSNKMSLLDWSSRQQKVQLVVEWQCDKCSKSQGDKVESFRKFGKLFCSIKCLKSFSF